MYNLIRKDITLHKKYIFLTMIVVIVGTFLLLNSTDSQQYYVTLYILPLTILNMVIGRFNYADDQDNMRLFIKSLPYSKYENVGTRFLETLVLTLISILYALIIDIFFYRGLEMITVIHDALIATSVILIYQGFSLWLFFFKNYRISQNALVICCILLLGLCRIVTYFNVTIIISDKSIDILMIGLFVYTLFFYISCKTVR